jgi:predicted kinase
VNLSARPAAKGPGRLFVMVGLPASGKTTRAREIEREFGALRLTPDEWMIPLFGESEAGGRRDVLEGRFVWLAIHALSLGVKVILDFGVWSKEERSALRYLALSVGAICEFVYVDVDEAEQRRRVATRIVVQPESTFPLSEDDLDRYRELFQVPDRAELESSEVDPPPEGYPTWSAWAAERWPTSIEAR